MVMSKTKRVMGIGGIFLKTRNSMKLARWYKEHLGIPVKNGAAVFAWRGFTDPKRKGHTVWALFSAKSEYFGRMEQKVMVNYRVKDLRSILDRLREEGVKVEDKVEETRYGKFGWIFDPEGNRIELWEPPRNYRSPETPLASE